MLGLSCDLTEQLAFYGAYHSHPVNKAIHFVFVPTIVWATLVWLAAAGPIAPLPAPLAAAAAQLPPWLGSGVAVNLPLLFLAAYAAFYAALDPVAGASWTLVLGAPLAATATAFQRAVPNAAWWALGVQVVSWYMQIHPGHAVFEGRKPALLDSLVQAFALAPLFVWFELLFLLGYRPRLRAELEKRVGREVAAWRRSQKAAGGGGGGRRRGA
ncbi:DUF962 domain-containing protein [Raphidocelis subcapitata]|uniref:DUF962 domain-containing protein n=1 Tax=Raphidocelis subcapitata TaxID=307507 RepID=A0A2V0NPC5_9CHLO|nr:DUF962 domain-containing protein [Raphidocelis subcapitata]|eukprot:GBF89468.1 DUF962 domain-containing protein [Raphidocelis subcapitata]